MHRLSTKYRGNMCDEMFSPHMTRESSLTLRSVLDEPRIRRPFVEFMRKQGFAKKVDFWHASVSHEMLPHESSLRQESAQQIYDTFFADVSEAM